MSAPIASNRRSSAILVYVIVIIALQLFLLVVTLEAFQSDKASLAWAAAGLSVGLFATSLIFARLLHDDR